MVIDYSKLFFKIGNKAAILINKILKPFKIKISRVGNIKSIYPVEATERDIEIINYILNPDWDKKLSLVTIDKLMNVIQSTKYIIENNIEGDFVECGVWRGGCSLAIAMVLNDLKVDRKIYLFDTFEGMTRPGNEDYGYDGFNPLKVFEEKQKDNFNDYCYASLEYVVSKFKDLKLDKYATFIKGDVLKTLNQEENIPNKIALLRLDTDWYESTKLEMEKLYPKLVRNGVLLIDDYGDWQGCKKAIDEYFKENNSTGTPLLWGNRSTGKGLVKK